MNKKILKQLFCVILCMATVASAALLMNVDTNNETFYFTGQTAGHLTDYTWGNFFSINGNGSSTATGLVLENGLPLSITATTAYLNNVRVNSTSNPGFHLGLVFSGATEGESVSITGLGDGFKVDYSGVAGTIKSGIELGIGQTITSAMGTLSVVAVPEPATMALLGLGGILIRRRKA